MCLLRRDPTLFYLSFRADSSRVQNDLNIETIFCVRHLNNRLAFPSFHGLVAREKARYAPLVFSEAESLRP